MTPEELEGEKSSLVPSLSEGTYEELLEGDRKEIHGEVENEFPGHGHAVLEYTLTRLISDAGFEGVVGVARDVTERKERERELRKNERRFEAVFEDPKMLVGLLDSDGTVLRINSTAMGYTEDESDDVVGEPFWETSWWQTDDELRADARRWTERAGDGEYVEFEAEHVRPGGATATVSGVFRPVTEEGEVSSVVASARDITERKEREKTIKRRNELLEDVAGFLSHDMRTPLTTVRGWLEMAVETGETEHVERSFTALDRMEELLADMTDVLRTGEVIGETEEVRLEEAVETVSETVQASELTIEVENSPRVECDEEALRRILENLVSNSVEHDAKDGDTEVRIGEMDEGFYYEDDGPGIPEEKRDDIFKPGFSTKSGSKGTGMGLASVRQTVLAHGWDIRVGDAETLDGARFEVLTDV
ncbi:MAG: PAS domain-containing sensor histidine kinase [Halobacteriales archaeon]|nr:PAS domain-containing sensor histidine kinase [Halobacteriales archaeon]